MGPAASELQFRRRHRLSHASEFQAVYGARVKKARGPLVVFGLPNDREECRLGLAVGKRAGPAVTRNRIKRLVREAFRLRQHELPRSKDGRYDLVVSVREPAGLTLTEVQSLLEELAGAVHREWEKRQRRAGADQSVAASEPRP